jgi:hypothetical protein
MPRIHSCDEPCDCDPNLACFCCGAQGTYEHGCEDCEITHADERGGQHLYCRTHLCKGESVLDEAWPEV